MTPYSKMRDEYFAWSETPLEPLVHKAIISDNGVASSRYEMNGRTAALIVAVCPKVEPWKGRAEHYFDENQGNPIDSIRGASYSLILDHAFTEAAHGHSSVFVIYNPPVVIIASVVENQIQALERDYL